ncbi:MAG: DUF881 domain-containing protein [Actinobacteria bacterium]|nr:DUF881 domain-containing protein [Actinomycetota bacterium]
MPRSPAAAVRRAVVRALVKARAARGTAASRLLTVVVIALAGVMMASAAVAARGQDLRPNRNTDVIELVRAQAARNVDLARQVGALRAEVDKLSTQQGGSVVDTSGQAEAGALTAVKGPAVSVTLTDAPTNVTPVGVAEELLIVHQQDIQAVVNAIWEGGAEAMTIQGQRVTSRTGIKCVGNSVLLHGVPYAPPYVLVAIGNQKGIEEALASSAYLDAYRQYRDRYGLGYAEKRVADVTLPGYTGAIDLGYAKPSAR